MERAIIFHQKSLIHLINGELTRQSSRQQRWQSNWVEAKKAFQLNPKDWITSVLSVCHPLSFGWPNISLSIEGVSLTNELLEQLARVSVSTVQRWLAWCSWEIDRLIASHLAHQNVSTGCDLCER